MPTNPSTCHAQILLMAGKSGIDIELTSIEDENNKAVKFAKWICENSQMLMEVFNETRLKEKPILQHRPRLLGPDGKLVN